VRKIVSDTTFVSESHDVWNIEVQSSTHSRTLVEATAGTADGLSSSEANTEIEEETVHRAIITDDEKPIEEKLEKEHKAIEKAKEEVVRDERAQIAKMIEIVKLKKQVTSILAAMRKTETTTLPVKHEAVKNMDREYYDKLKTYEDAKMARRKHAS
jgi:hypothetical protein